MRALRGKDHPGLPRARSGWTVLPPHPLFGSELCRDVLAARPRRNPRPAHFARGAEGAV